MPALMVGVCPACQGNNHENCAAEGSCACSLRQHPEIKPLNSRGANTRYVPEPE